MNGSLTRAGDPPQEQAPRPMTYPSPSAGPGGDARAALALLVAADEDRGDLILIALLTPDFARVGRVHDWRNYVPDAVQAVWGDLSLLARASVYCVAEQRAGAEEWD